ncbi:hypothetical protein H6G35_28955 [Aulosira sp. FACHB-113]|uniref:hypothetical protein n=1 Tax=Tolypothrix tenuis TaxID=457083 RepID=UPI0016861615|nr:hypothetical protein [Nostoc linckia FACHB-104]MBD2240571.1 hypothetical protein [Aulosira sp. FACHB-113]
MLIFASPYFRHTLQAIALNSRKYASVIGSVLRPLIALKTVTLSFKLQRLT